MLNNALNRLRKSPDDCCENLTEHYAASIEKIDEQPSLGKKVVSQESESEIIKNDKGIVLNTSLNLEGFVMAVAYD